MQLHTFELGKRTGVLDGHTPKNINDWKGINEVGSLKDGFYISGFLKPDGLWTSTHEIVLPNTIFFKKGCAARKYCIL